MKLMIIKNSKIVAKVNSKKEASEFLGWTGRQVTEVLDLGTEIDGITLDYEAPKTNREGNAVCAYSATTVFRFNSLAHCAREYGISRAKLERLIETGSTLDDGITTFDIPLS